MYAVTGFLLFALAATASNLVAGDGECPESSMFRDCGEMLKIATDYLTNNVDCFGDWWDEQDIDEKYYTDMSKIHDVGKRLYNRFNECKDEKEKSNELKEWGNEIQEKMKGMHEELSEEFKNNDKCKKACQNTMKTIMCQ